MGRINILDTNMVNMIAAGEVIERPASVVKELVENSLDAGATRISVHVEDGGKNLISVTDNGSGMDADDLSRAFEPHATSKLRSVDDLMKITTMGFRGEALASIGSVAKVAVTSRGPEQIQANRIEIDCGQKTSVRPCSGDVGTTIEVRNLFYKLPGRRKFLRTAGTEISHITEQFTRIALSYTDIEMSLSHNSKKLYNLSARQRVNERIAKLFSSEIADSLLKLNVCEKKLEITAFLGSPNNVRANSKLQYFFLNGRFVRDKVLSGALRQAYQGLTEPRKYPIAFVFLKVPPESFDINVHPTKVEVRFDNSHLIYSQVYGILREKLLSLDSDVMAELPPKTNSNFLPSSSPSFNQSPTGLKNNSFRFSASSSVPQEHFDFSKIKSQSDLLAADERAGFYSKNSFKTAADDNRYLQVHNSYIIAEVDDGFVIIDQHALHERIMYERLCQRLTSDEAGRLQSQKLLVPETFDPTVSQLTAFEDNKQLLSRLGIELEIFGPSTLAIQSFPTLLSKVNPVEFVTDALDILAESDEGVDAEKLLHKILDMASCKAAVKAGQKLTTEEIKQLLADKDKIERAGRCPHGRPTVIKFTLEQLQKQFKRT